MADADKNQPISSSAQDLGLQSQLLAKSAVGARYLIILQIGSRALTFAVNQILLRFLSPELLGISTQLEVYSISILFFSREALRVAFQRQTDSVDINSDAAGDVIHKDGQSRTDRAGARKTQQVVNMAFLSISLGVIFAVGLYWVYTRSVQSDQALLQVPFFVTALQLYSLAAMVELLAEPSFAVVMQKSEYKIRAAAESMATVMRCLTVCVTTFVAHRKGLELGVLPFALGQSAYALSILSVYTSNVWLLSKSSGFSLLPQKMDGGTKYVMGYFSQPLLSLGASLFVQGVLKHFLTQGDVLLISYFTSLQEQGVYALASNYGGLVARMIFQPLEESSRNYFGKQLSTIEREPTTLEIRTASGHLHQLLRAYGLLSITAAAIGPSVAPLLLRLVVGSRWTSSGAGEVLGKYCYYVPLLAVNGVTEAFISAVASKSDLNRQSIWMVAFSFGFGVAGYTFLKVLNMGAEGLVWANVLNMAVRILWSLHFIKRYLSSKGSSLDLKSLLPTLWTTSAGIGTATVLQRLSSTMIGNFWDYGKVSLSAALYITILAISERQYLLQLYKSMRSR